MGSVLVLLQTMAELFGTLKNLSSQGNQRRRDDEYRREVERIWSQIAQLQNQFFTLMTVLMNQSFVNGNLQARLDDVTGTVRSIQTQMFVQMQSGIMGQPTDLVAKQVLALAENATQEIKALPIPDMLSVATSFGPLVGDISGTMPAPKPPLQFELPPSPVPLPAPPMTPGKRLITLIRQEMTSADYYHAHLSYRICDPWTIIAFTNSDDMRIHALALLGDDPQAVQLRYYRYAYGSLPSDDDPSVWEDIFDRFQRLLNTSFVALPDVGIQNLVARIERADLDAHFA